MSTENPTPATTTATSTPTKPAAPKPGFNAKGEEFPGVDPDTGERVTVTFEGLKQEFGDEKGASLYRQIAGIRGGSQFFHPDMESTNYHPALSIAGLNNEDLATVTSILTKE
jgi:hypothetical protein